MKSRWICFGALLLLTACGGGGDSATVTCAQEYWNGEYGTCLPEGWSPLDSETLLLRGVTDEFTVVFQAAQAVSGQFPLVTITRQRLPKVVDAETYSSESVRAVASLLGYQQIDIQDVSVDGNNLKMHIFKARPEATQPERRFYQISTSNNNIGYTVTGMVPISVRGTTEASIEKILACSTWALEPEARTAVWEGC